MTSDALSTQNGKDMEAAARVLEPPVDVYEGNDSLLLLVDVPGVDKDQLDVQVQGNSLSIRAARRDVSYERSFRLPDTVDHGKIRVALSQGVARIELPKQEHAKPQRIPVN